MLRRLEIKKLQYDINREATKISALSSGKFDKYEYLIGENILGADESRVMEQAKFTYSPLGKVLEKQKNTYKNEEIKTNKCLRSFKNLLKN